jgi:YXWGXW repeat-containing protein
MPIKRSYSLLFGWLALATISLMLLPTTSSGQVSISVNFGPPPLPVYEQPPCPAEGYIWTPGYWAWGDDGYYWVPGTWVLAPQPGFLWTPAWWGWDGGVFLFHEGYWGPRVGFYGGIVYGYGYFGHGFEGGRWDHDRFYYNRSVTNVNVTNIRNVYNTTVINNTTVNRVSYNGGNGGIQARPRPEEEAAERERHIPPVAAQTRHFQEARSNPELRAAVNHGKPVIAATPRPAEFRDRNAVPAKAAGGAYNPPPNRGEGRPQGNADVPRPGNNVPRPGNNAPRPENTNTRAENRNNMPRPENNVPRPPAPGHAKDLQPHERPAPVNTGSPKNDKKYQQQQDKLYQKQEQEHQKLQQKQEQEHQRMQQRNTDEARRQQMEQKHEQQTQRMEQKHGQQEQKLQNKEQRPR